jgi:CRP-like cAMP-binding protein/Zn-dependent protease
LAERVDEPSDGDRVDVWALLDSRMDPAGWRPEVGDWVELRRFELPWNNSYAVAGNLRELIYYRLTPAEADLVDLFDGSRTVAEIAVEQLSRSGELELSGVAELADLLYSGGFLVDRYIDTDEALAKALHPVRPARAKLREFVRTLSIEWRGAERLVKFSYRWGLRWVFTRIGLVVAAILAIGGFAAFGDVVANHGFHITAQSVGVGFVVLFTLNMAIVFIHELGHALVLVHHGRRVKSAGFRIYFGSPAFFVDSSDALLMGRGPRIAQAFAGPGFEMVTSGVAAMLLWAFPTVPLSSTLYRFVLLNYFVLFLNLVPLLELDGYWILSDALQLPDLRPRSLAFMRSELWRKLLRRERFTRSEVGLGVYGLVGVVFTVACFYTAYFFWRRTFGKLISKMWHGGPIGVVLLALLGVFLTGPVIRAFLDAVRAVARRLRAGWRRLQFRTQRNWRIAAAEMVDAQPVFADLPVDVLEEVAGRVQLRSYPLGAAVVHQGDRADAYYLVRSGALEVVEQDTENQTERVLRVVGPGESFGDIGLAEAAPRSATVRTTRPSELFVIDKGTFDRLLADRIQLPDIGTTLGQLGELRALPPFAHLATDDLGDLLIRGRWINYEPSTAIVTQGESGDHFYVIGSGQAEVVRDGERVGTLGPGSHFGEIALLLALPRTATVQSLTPLRAFELDRDGFAATVADAFRRGNLHPNVTIDRGFDH